VEIDFSAVHPRLAYHLRKLECHGDPYSLWGDQTTAALRNLAKLLINTALNARSRHDAIGACFEAIRLKTKDGGWKEGNQRQRAQELRKALCQTLGINTRSDDFFKQARAFFADVYDLAIKYHESIEADFGADAGSSFMRVESSIALDVLHRLAQEGIPALGIHDSFIVPESYSDILHQLMCECYRAKMGFDPVVK
jgi:hypothetical protein